MPDGGVRVPPLDPAEFTPEQAALVGDWTHLVFSRVIVRHPAMYRNFVPHIAALIAQGTLPPRDREIVVLHLLARCDETYELHHHRAIAANNAGMSEDEIAAAEAGEGAALTLFDHVLIAATGQLLDHQRIDDATWAALGERYGTEQKMELVFLAGLYATMAMLTRSFAMPLEDDAGDLAKIQALRDYE